LLPVYNICSNNVNCSNCSKVLTVDAQTVHDHTYSVISEKHDLLSSHDLKFAVLNICGLMNKLKYIETQEFIQNYDIVGLVETKLDNYDTVQIKGYKFISLNRQVCRRKSGGIGLLVKESLFSSIKILDPTNEYCLWFKVDQSIVKSDIIFGVIYIPPEGSPYSDSEIFDNIENDILNLTVDSQNICLMGDFNSRTGILSDFLNFDENIFAHDVELFSKYQSNKNNLNLIGFPLERCSQDNTCNNYGHRLTDLCKTFDIHIANGRCGTDSGVGAFTTTKNSVIDYVLMSSELLSHVSKFDILTFDPILSDIHTPISFSIVCDFKSVDTGNITLDPNHNIASEPAEKPIWDANHREDFVNSFSQEDINSITQQLDDLANNVLEPTSQTIDSLVSDISNLYVKAARNADMIKATHPKKTCNKKSFKPWYDNQCKDKRSLYMKAKKTYRRVNSVRNFETLKETSKAYKKIINLKFHQ